MIDSTDLRRLADQVAAGELPVPEVDASRVEAAVDIYDEARAEHGTDHLIGWASEYASRRPLTRRDIVKAMSLLGAAADLITPPDREVGTEPDTGPAVRCPDCGCVWRDHEAFCWSCGAGRPEEVGTDG